jgi:ABC-type transport system involved in cytochrome bd biosynthesis fused ATPase/permease subunit
MTWQILIYIRNIFQAMQSNVLTDEYIKKLNEIIEFFKTEKENQMYFQNFGVKHTNYHSNIFLSTMVILLGASNALLIAGAEFKNLSLIILLIVLSMVGIYMIAFSRRYDKRIEDIVHEANKYNVIINHLQSLKTLPYEVDLSKLIDKIKHRYHIKTTPFIDENYIFETWFEEIRGCLNEINKEISEKERSFGEQ